MKLIGTTIDTPDKKGITLLMYASAYGKEHTVKYLLSKGANPVQRTQTKMAQQIIPVKWLQLTNTPELLRC